VYQTHLVQGVQAFGKLPCPGKKAIFRKWGSQLVLQRVPRKKLIDQGQGALPGGIKSEKGGQTGMIQNRSDLRLAADALGHISKHIPPGQLDRHLRSPCNRGATKHHSKAPLPQNLPQAKVIFKLG
jgi:hypothetical protein